VNEEYGDLTTESMLFERYHYDISQCHKTKQYIAEVREFPLLVVYGETYAQALASIKMIVDSIDHHRVICAGKTINPIWQIQHI